MRPLVLVSVFAVAYKLNICRPLAGASNGLEFPGTGERVASYKPETQELRLTPTAVRMTSDLTVSLRTTVSFGECLEFLKQALFRAGFQVIAQVPFHLAFKKHLGVQLANYTALMVWHPFQAYRGVLGDPEAGLFNPFCFVVADEGEFTAVLSPDHSSIATHSTPLTVRLMLCDLHKSVGQVFAELEALDRLETNLKAGDKARKEAS